MIISAIFRSSGASGAGVGDGAGGRPGWTVAAGGPGVSPPERWLVDVGGGSSDESAELQAAANVAAAAPRRPLRKYRRDRVVSCQSSVVSLRISLSSAAVVSVPMLAVDLRGERQGTGLDQEVPTAFRPNQERRTKNEELRTEILKPTTQKGRVAATPSMLLSTSCYRRLPAFS
jgi:hypothetical protein